MQLQTSRVSIRPLTLDDVPEFVAYRRIEAVARFQSWTTDYSERDAARLVAEQQGWTLPPEGEWMQFGVHEHGSLAGDLAVHRLADQPGTFEFGVTLAPSHGGRGIATEAAIALVDALITEHGAHRVVAFCDARNDSVIRLFERVGLRRESRQVEADWFKGEWTTLEGWAVLAREWAQGRRVGTRR